MTESPPTWRSQYDLLFKILMDENTRFWTRFNVSLLINGGLIVAFSSLIGYAFKSSDIGFGILGTIVITIAGIILSVIWLIITQIGKSWLHFYHEKIKTIEKENLPENLRIFHQKGIIRGSITKTSVAYPVTFIIFWIVLIIVTLLHFNLIPLK